MQDIQYMPGFLPFWEQLNGLEKQTAQSAASFRQFSSGASVYSGGTGCMGLVCVLSGELRVYILSPEGREITLFRLKSGQECLLTASCALKAITFEVHVDADRETQLMIISAKAFELLMAGNIHVEAFAYKSLAERFSQVMFVMQQMLFQRFDRRLAIFLLEETDKTGSLSLHLTHEQIARYLGSAREVVSRMLKYFMQDGLVSLSRGGLKVLDTEKLKLIAAA